MEDFVYNPETKELKTSDKDAKPCTPGGIGKILFEKLQQNANNGLIAHIEAETGITDSIQDFLVRCKKFGIYLQEIGIQCGDVITACAPNSPKAAVPLISSFFIGAICSYIDPCASLDNATYLLKLTKPKLLIVDDDCVELIEQAKLKANINCKLITLQFNSNYENLPNIFKRYPDDSNIVQYFEPIYVEDLNSTACILFSSGTTGMPKAACLSHHYLSTHIFTDAYAENFRLREKQSVMWCFSSLYWLSGVSVALVVCYYGLIALTSRRFNKETVWEIVEKFKVNKMIMSYYYCIEARETLEKPQLSVDCLIIVGGEIPPKTEDKFVALCPNVRLINSYGITEIGSVTLSADYKIRSTGKPMRKDLTIKIVDPETEEPLDLNQAGEIRIKHIHQMNGYYMQDSADCWDDQGFFKTGDIGYLTSDYNLFIVNRIKEMFKYRSYHVIPSKIERYLLQHPKVQLCVVIGVPDLKDDHHAMAIVVLTENNNNSDSGETSNELLEFVNDEMDELHQIRAGVKIVSEDFFSYTVTGKINRRSLQDKIINLKNVNTV